MGDKGMAKSSVPLFTRVDYSGSVNVGLVRVRCEDALTIGKWVGVSDGAVSSDERRLTGNDTLGLAVVDGMGGHAGGADAAGLVALGLATFQDYEPEMITGSLEALSDRVASAGKSWGQPDMGATFAMMVIGSTGIAVFNLGDCRVARLVDGYVGALTVEDRAVSSLHGGQTVVTQSLGGASRILDPHYMEFPHLSGTTRFLVSSDGLHHEVDDDVIARELTCGSPREVVHRLTDAVLATGARDNFTVLVVDVTPDYGAEVAQPSEETVDHVSAHQGQEYTPARPGVVDSPHEVPFAANTDEPYEHLPSSNSREVDSAE